MSRSSAHSRVSLFVRVGSLFLDRDLQSMDRAHFTLYSAFRFCKPLRSLTPSHPQKISPS